MGALACLRSGAVWPNRPRSALSAPHRRRPKGRGGETPIPRPGGRPPAPAAPARRVNAAAPGRKPWLEHWLTTGGIVALVAAVLLTLLAAMTGGKTGERYHKKVDRVGYDL